MSKQKKPVAGWLNETISKDLNLLIITANVGTLFENMADIEETWIEELLKVIKSSHARFVALHCQEVGGKDYKTVFDPVIKFFKKLSNLKELEDFTVVRSFLDGKYDNPDQFTALGNVYMVHRSVTRAEIFNFETEKFIKTCEKKLVSDKETSFSHARKEKFDPDFFSECKWSRKGYIRVRWKINDKVLEFVNVHLFHDDSNLKAVRKTPSQYTTYRKRALNYVMNKLQTEYPLADSALQFVFGDFNFRLDVKSLIQGISPTLRQQITRSSSDDVDDDVIRMIYRSSEESNGDARKQSCDEDVVVTLEKKFFQIKHKDFQPNSQPEKLRCYDIEFSLKDVELKEYEVTFPPTYPYSENLSEPNDYMKTRCPSWCDRILLSTTTWDWLHSLENTPDVIYDVIGKTVCMGDHKPVYLAFTVPCTDREEAKSVPTNENGKK